MSGHWVWIDAAEKIASFHETENSKAMYFEQHEQFLLYLSKLAEQGYRFQ